MKKILLKIIFISTIVFIALTTFQCNNARLIIRNSDFKDTLYVYTDTIIPAKYNKYVPYSYDKTLNLYQYKVFYDPLVILSCRLRKIKTDRQRDDTIKVHLPIYYLKLVKKSKQTYVAPNKTEIVKLFKYGNSDNIEY